MASINKLSIRGVRSFSPDEEEQVISFCFPVTIIVGANGCGKTTIIESLKYAVTGALPPGNKSGHAFVHDPKSLHQSTVKACIKLRFTNRASRSMVVVRTMEVTQKKTTLQFKALDGILRTTDPATGERVSLSHKCTELDKQIPTLMGVSRPILEHVVFCHQEDSSWPLQEGAVLKKRFDDIFDSTRYAKALEAIRKSRLEYQSSAKDLKADLAGLASHKHASQQYVVELEETVEALQELQAQQADLDKQLDKEGALQEQANTIMEQVEKMEQECDAVRNQIKHYQSMLQKQRQMLERDMTSEYSEKDLQGMLQGFDGTIQDDETTLSTLKEQMKGIEQAIHSLRQNKSNTLEEIAKLDTERTAHEAVVKERLQGMMSLAQQYNVELPVTQRSAAAAGQGALSQATAGSTSSSTASSTGVGATTQQQGSGTGAMFSQETSATVLSSATASDVQVTTEDWTAFRDAVSQTQDQLQEKFAALQKKHVALEDELQSTLSDLQAKLKSIEHERERNTTQQQNLRRELQELSRKSSSSLTSKIRKSDIDEARRQAERLAKQRDEAANHPRRTEIPKEIRTIESQMETIKRTIEDDNLILKELRLFAEHQNAVEVLRQQVDQDVESLEEFLKDNSFVLQKHNIYPPSLDLEALQETMEDMAKSAQEKHMDASLAQSAASSELSLKQRQYDERRALVDRDGQTRAKVRQSADGLAGAATQMQRLRKQVQSLDAELRGVYVITEDTSPRDLLNHVTVALDEFSKEEVQPESIHRSMAKLRKMAAVPRGGGVFDARCPCCLRDMDVKEAEVYDKRMKELMNVEQSELIRGMVAEAQSNRSAIEKLSEWRTAISNGMDEYQEYQRLRSELESLDKSIRDGESELATLQAEMEEKKKEVEEQDEMVTELRQVMDLSSRLRDDAVRIADKRSQIKSKEDDMSISAPSCSTSRDWKQVERDVSDNMEEKDRLMDSIAKLNRETSGLNDQLSRLTAQAAKAEQMVKEKETKYAQEQAAAERKTELNKLIETCGTEDKKLLEQLAPLRSKVRTKETEKQRMRSTSKAEEGKAASHLNNFKNDVRSLEGLNSRIERFLESNKLQQLEKLRSSVSEMDSQAEAKEKERNVLEPKLAELQKKVDDQERHKKVISDNLELLESQKKEASLRDNLELLEDDVNKVEGAKTATKDYEAASERIAELRDERSRLEGRRGGLKDQQRQLKRKLQTPEYKNIDERHRQKMIEYETTLLAVGDLDKYHSALDKALLRYHGMKIEDINKIIRELWTLTYKGEDITNIELVSGQEEGSRAARSYNYRVVMTKGSTQMDMRGRCSAGQRVLASIVIRLALAETFCLNCGVMALDEPTTNLDHANKRGLAIALAQIIASRASSQSNFQLVIITHDEDFVMMMKTELAAQAGNNFTMPDKYFQVSREESHDGKHYSKIMQVDWDDI